MVKGANVWDLKADDWKRQEMCGNLRLVIEREGIVWDAKFWWYKKQEESIPPKFVFD